MAKKKVRLLKDVHFDFEGAHIALTSKGAASQVDEPFLLKSLEIEESNKAAGTATDNTGVNKSAVSDDHKQENEDVMSQEVIKQLQEQLVALQAEREAEKVAIQVEKAAIAFGKYDLGEELVKELSESFYGEEKELVIKALDVIVSAKEEAVLKAKEVNPAKDEIELAKEKGSAGEVEEDVEVVKTLAQQAQEILKAQMEKK